MTDFPIPPEVIEAAARACYEYWREKDTTKTLPPWESERFIPFREGWRDQATAACRAMLKAWPNANWDEAHTIGIILPLPTDSGS